MYFELPSWTIKNNCIINLSKCFIVRMNKCLVVNYTIFRPFVLIILEWVWNQYPSTTMSSLLLHAVHILIIIGLLTAPSTKSHDLKQS